MQPTYAVQQLGQDPALEPLFAFQDEHDDLATNFTQGSPAQRLRLFVLPTSPNRTR